MATSFNLQEYILFRTEIKRELTNAEVDTNFKMVANPWENDRVYEIGNIVYHPVIVDDPATTGLDQVLAWWRANTRTTQGVFDTSQWDMIGGIGSGNINIQGANSFGRITVNSTAPTGALQSGNDATVTSTTPNDIFNLIAGQGMQLQYNLASKSIVLVNTLASNPGEINDGLNIGTGTGHQDVFAGKNGVNLEFKGFQATNTGVGAALSISTNSLQKNIEYNFNEGLIDLTQLNSGAPTIGMLSNVSSAAPNAQDILQYNIGSQTWIPVSLGSLGQVNIYGDNGTIGAATREVKLNGTAGQLQFNRISDLTTGIHFDNTSANYQLQLRNSSPTGVAAQTYSLNNVVKAISGVFGTDGSFGIDMSGVLGGLAVDALSISSNNELYIPQIASDSLTATGITYRIPLVNTGAQLGRFESSDNYDLRTYTDQGGAVDMIKVDHKGSYVFTGVSEQNVLKDVSLSFTTEHDYAANAVLDEGVAMAISYKTPTTREAVTFISQMDKSDRRFTGINFQTDTSGMPVGSTVNKYVGSNISLDDMLGSTAPIINVGQLISFSNTTGAAGTSPQRVGVYANVVNDYTGTGSQNGEQALTQLIADSGTWAGYFVGCVNIDQGGLVLPSTTFANRPLCNDVSGGTVSDRTLWINSANGHLYRGTVDIEASGGGGSSISLTTNGTSGPATLIGNVLNIPQYTGGSGSSTLAGLSDVTLNDPLDDQLLVYNTATSQWENASLAAYNINAVAITSGGASIQLSDGSATSDVDLLPGTNITFSVNEVTDEITINAANPPQQINIGNTDLYITEPRTLDFYDPGNALNNPLTFINTNGGTKTLFKFEQIGTGLTPQFTVGGNATDSEGLIVITGNGSGRTGTLRFNDDDGSNYTTFKAPTTLANNINYVLPDVIGSLGDVLQVSNQAGTTATLKWTTPSGGGGVGATGASGFTGATGSGGATGATGVAGGSGEVGATGSQGATGAVGLQGATGIVGFDGATGAVGLQGATGELGFTGSTGAIGNQGRTGNQGATGSDGAIGGQGASGVSGASGAIGLQGATGETGANGLQGATGTQGKIGPDGLQGATGGAGPLGGQGASGVAGSGDYGGFTTAYNSAAVSGSGFQTGKAVSNVADWKTSGADFYLSAQGTDPASGGTTIDYDVTKTVYANINNNAANGDKIYFRIWEYGSPEDVNFYETAISQLSVSTGLNGGFQISKVQYIGGRDIATFTKPLFGWGVTGSAGVGGATGPTGASGFTGATGSGGGGSDETLLWAGNRGYRAFIPNYSTGLYSFGQGTGASLPAGPGYTQVSGPTGIVLANNGNLNTYFLTAGYRVNQAFDIGAKILVRGSLWFNRTNLTTVTNLSQLNTAVAYVNSNGVWDPASSTQTLVPFAGTNNTDTHIVRTGANGSTCIFEHEIVCDAAATVNIGDLLYFGWSIENIGGEATYFSNACSISYQVYKA